MRRFFSVRFLDLCLERVSQASHKYCPRSWDGFNPPTTGIFEVQKQRSLPGPTTKLISALRHVDTIQLSRVIEHTVFATPILLLPPSFFRCHRLTTIPLPQKITTDRTSVWTRTVLPESKEEKRISASAWYDYFFPPAHDSQSVSYHYFECHPLFSSITLSLLSKNIEVLGLTASSRNSDHGVHRMYVLRVNVELPLKNVACEEHLDGSFMSLRIKNQLR